MNKEITPNEIANAIRDLLEERDEFQERLKEQDKTLQSWYNDYHKLKKQLDKYKIVLDKIKKMFEHSNLIKYYYGMSYEFEINDFKDDILELLEEIE